LKPGNEPVAFTAQKLTCVQEGLGLPDSKKPAVGGFLLLSGNPGQIYFETNTAGYRKYIQITQVYTREYARFCLKSVFSSALRPT
jgi:hypothetical protein